MELQQAASSLADRVIDGDETCLDALCELAKLDSGAKKQLCPRILDYALGHLSEYGFDSIVRLSKVFGFGGALVDKCAETLVGYASAHSEMFNEELVCHLKGDNEDIDPAHYLKFVETLFIADPELAKTFPAGKIDDACFAYSSADGEFAKQALDVLRWRSQAISHYDPAWKAVFVLPPTSSFTLWIRLLTQIGVEDLKTDAKFQFLMTSDQYWSLILTGLLSELHERRKFALMVLQISIEALNTNVSTSIMSWDNSRKQSYLPSWSKFFTLYTIMGIDTADNQMRAASKDLVQVLSPDSSVPAPFALTVLSVGFTGPTDSMKKCALNLALDLPKSSLSLLGQDNFHFLTQVFLPFASTGSLFEVEDQKCTYGEQLVTFIADCVKSSGPEAVEKVLEFLVSKKTSYSPPRIYITKGLLKGVKGQLCVTPAALNQLYLLFDSHIESPLGDRVLQELHLQFLLHIDPHAVNVETVFLSLGYFVKFNGYAIDTIYEDSFLDFISSHFSQQEVQGCLSPSLEVNSLVILCSYLNDPATIQFPLSDSFFVTAAKSGLGLDKLLLSAGPKLGQLVGRMFQMDRSLRPSLYTDSQPLISNKSLFSYEFWEHVDVNTLYSRIKTVPQLQFFRYCVTECKYNANFDMSSTKILTLARRPPKDYKQKDLFFSAILDILAELPCGEEVLEFATSVVSQSQYHSLKSNTHLLENLVDRYPEQVFRIAKSIWTHLAEDRLVMRQRDLHHEMIRLLCHPSLLKSQGEDLCRIFIDIIQDSVSRRSLLPVLFKSLSDFQVTDPTGFEKSTWLSKVLVQGAFLFQSTENTFLLDEVVGKKLYAEYYGDPEIAYRIYIKAMVASVTSQQFADSIWTYILENDSLFHLITPVKKTDHKEQRQRLELLSLLLSTVTVADSSKWLAETLVHRLLTEVSPLCRTYIEWMAALKGVSVPLDLSRPMAVCIYQRVEMLKLMQQKEVDIGALERLLQEVVIPNSTSSRALTRHFSTAMACVALEEIKKRGLEMPELVKTLEGIWEIASGALKFGNFRTGDTLLWSIDNDYTLCGVNGGVLAKTSDLEVGPILEKSWKKYLNPDQRTILRLPIGHDEEIEIERHTEIKQETHIAKEEESLLLQTKSGAWATPETKRTPLIVMASLVNKAPNLGGICRLSECLGAGWMTVNDLSVKKDSVFKSVAVTADKWMPLIEVSIPQIVQFMLQKKQEGYTLIGLEQTDNSVQLNRKLKFPAKSLIVLGKEREGIPADILAELDMCVVIKQAGIVRSMNIQTATAVIVEAYSEQH